MMKFQEFRTKTTPVYEATKKFKVGKGKFTAEIKKKGSKFIASIDGQDLDTFKSALNFLATKSIFGFETLKTYG